jgi:hypothetical protein
VECIGTDGKRDKKTLKKVVVVVNGEEVEKREKGKEEHVVYTREPGGEYITHSTITDGTGKGLAEDYRDVCAEIDALRSLLAVLCDGTAVNVGWRLGLVATLERLMQRKLLLLSCMLHANELPLRHLFTACDGGHGTTGPESFGGPIGKLAGTPVHLMDLVSFTPIETPLPDLPDGVWKDLSGDQKLMYRYVKAIQDGEVPSSLKTCKCGPMNHSRWLTLAIRLLILYTRTDNPAQGLQTVVTFIMQVYAPMWFILKKASSFTEAPLALFTWMKLVEKQPEGVQLIVKPVVQHNAWAAEPGYMLCAMLAAPELSVRKRAVELIRTLRKKPQKKPRMKLLQGIRKLMVPPLQWSAESWVDIINWKKATVSEPYILERLTLQQVEEALVKPLELPKFPLHSQSVERAVKLVTEASSQVQCKSQHKYWYYVQDEIFEQYLYSIEQLCRCTVLRPGTTGSSQSTGAGSRGRLSAQRKTTRIYCKRLCKRLM